MNPNDRSCESTSQYLGNSTSTVETSTDEPHCSCKSIEEQIVQDKIISDEPPCCSSESVEAWQEHNEKKNNSHLPQNNHQQHQGPKQDQEKGEEQGDKQRQQMKMSRTPPLFPKSLQERKNVHEIVKAINSSESKKMTVSDICSYIQRTSVNLSQEPNLKGSVKYSLVYNECFIKAGISTAKSKHQYWIIHEDFKDLIELEFGTSNDNFSSLIEATFETSNKMDLNLEEIFAFIKPKFESINNNTELYWKSSLHFELLKCKQIQISYQYFADSFILQTKYRLRKPDFVDESKI